MKLDLLLVVRNGREWREWLAENHDKRSEIWLVYFKPGSNETGVDYETSVEEALCYGWVDSLIQKIDEFKYARKFNPRRPKSNWSTSNKARMGKLISEKRVTVYGMAKYQPDAPETNSPKAQDIKYGKDQFPSEIINQIAENQMAYNNFQALSLSQQRLYISWIASAKRKETRQKRITEAITRLEQGEKLGLR